jgi:hypothetical protein
MVGYHVLVYADTRDRTGRRRSGEGLGRWGGAEQEKSRAALEGGIQASPA